MLGFASEHAKDISARYGLISAQSVAAIQRALLKLEQDGADSFFGEPALELADLMRQDMSGRGVISVLAADTLILKPRLYSTFLLWLLSELFEQLPEVGDLDVPKMVFFFDEAHLLFDERTGGPAAARGASGPVDPFQGRGRTSVRRIRTMCPARSSASWAIACSTRCAPSRRATRRR